MKLEEREKGNQMEQLVIWQFLLQPYVVYLSNNLLDKREALMWYVQAITILAMCDCITQGIWCTCGVQYLSKELSDGCLAGLYQSLLGGGGAQDVVRGNTGLAGIDTLAPHDPLPGHINVCIISHNARAGGAPECAQVINALATWHNNGIK